MIFGFTQAVITPKLPCKLAGYAKQRSADTVHDDLYVKVFVFQQKQQLYALAAYDLLAVDHLIMDRVKQKCRQAELPFSHIFFSAIHTHSAAAGIIDSGHGFLKAAKDLLGEVDHAYIDDVADQTLKALSEAVDTMQKGIIETAYGSCIGVGANRNDKQLSGNSSLWIMEARHSDKKALIVNFACHPTILKADNCAISSDFCGAYAKAMEQQGYSMCLFLNGSCGDISSRFTRQGSDFEEVRRMGDKLASATNLLRKQLSPFSLERLEHRSLPICLKGRSAMSISEAKELLAQRKRELEQGKNQQLSSQALRLLESAVEGAMADYLYAASNVGNSEYLITVEMLKANDEIFIGIPAELFSELANPYEGEHTHFISYMNGYHMYIADQNAYEKQYYEASSSPFEKGEGEKLIQEIVKQIKKWRNQK